MKYHLAAILALSVAVVGCATQHHSNDRANDHADDRSTTTNSSSSTAAQHKNSGWYLMQPPLRHGDPDTRARSEDWQPLAFFDRAAECDAARAQGLSAYASYVPVSASTAIDSVQLSQRLASSSLCVDAKDPRINWFHIKWR